MQEKNFDILRYLFVLKLGEDWETIIKDLKNHIHRFNNPLLKQQIDNPTPPMSLGELKALTKNGDALFTSIQEILKNRLVDIIKERNEPHRIPQADISKKWLQEFIDPSKKRGKNKLHYKLENLELISLYIGVKEGYHKFEEFCEYYEIYKNTKEWFFVVLKMMNAQTEEDLQNIVTMVNEKVKALKHFKAEHGTLLVGELAINTNFDAIFNILEQGQFPPQAKNKL